MTHAAKRNAEKPILKLHVPEKKPMRSHTFCLGCWRFLAGYPRGGLTDEELALRLDVTQSNVRHHRKILENLGLVTDSGTQRETTRNTKKAIVWQVTEKGRTKLTQRPKIKKETSRG